MVQNLTTWAIGFSNQILSRRIFALSDCRRRPILFFRSKVFCAGISRYSRVLNMGIQKVPEVSRYIRTIASAVHLCRCMYRLLCLVPSNQNGVCSSHQTVFSTRRHPAHPVSVLILHPRETNSVITNYDTEIIHRTHYVMQ